jgi:ribokinase
MPQRARSGRLFVLGNAGLDIGLDLPGLPQPGETLLGRAAGRAPGGKGLNQAVVAARAALVPVLFFSPIGDDPDGQHVLRALASEPFAALELPVLAAPTDLSILMVLPGGENAIVSAGDCAHALPPAAATAFAARCAPGDWLLLQGNLLPPVTAAAIAAARARGARIMLNTAPVTADMAALLTLCDLVVANSAEAEQLAPGGAIHAAPDGVAIVTLGAEGCRVTRHGTAVNHPAHAVQVRDTTGAGDTFCGLLAAALAAGHTMDPAIAAAQAAAALTVTRPGAFPSLPTVTELHRILASPPRL